VPDRRPPFPLALKFFLGTAGVVLVVLGATLVLTGRSADRAADAAVARGLADTRARVAEMLRARERELASGALVFAQNPRFWPAVQRRQSENTLDQAQEAAQRIGASWVQIIDAQGMRLAKSDEPTAPLIELSGSALVGGALAGEITAGAGTEADTAIFQAVAVPILGDPIIGALMATRRIDDSLARALGAATSSEIVFFALDTLGEARVVAATLARSETLDSLAHALAAAAAGADTGASSTGGRSTGWTAVELGETHYLASTAPLRSAGGVPLGGFLAMRSRNAELASFSALRRTILLGGAAGLVAALLLSLALARTITRPVRALASATRQAADGDYDAAIAVRSRDEIGVLAGAFRALLAELRDKRALVDVLGAGDAPRAIRVSREARIAATPAALAGAGVGPESASSLAAPRAFDGPGVMTPLSGGMLAAGQRLAGRYEIHGVIGAGGMGIVYRASDRELGEIVAIKTLRPELVTHDPTALDRFKSEIRLARRISHRNVVRTHDLGEADGMYFITMEYVEGRSLKELIASRGALPVAASVTIGKQLCRALEVAHEQGVIHRDIKPQNIVVEADGLLKVMDFGIARLAQRTSAITQAGMVIGTPEYMAPEQLLGDELDARADLYAAGVVLYECLTGRVPFTAQSPVVLAAKLLEQTPRSPSEINHEVPPRLAAVVLRALAKDRAERPASATELHALLVESELHTGEPTD
jgi:serine/threonine-protein kinase